MKRMGLNLKNTSPKLKSTAGWQSKLRPGDKATNKPEKLWAEQKTTPIQTLKDSELRCRPLFETAQDGIFILDAETGMIKDINPYLTKIPGYLREGFQKKR
jgi:PAS domain-containing protein